VAASYARGCWEAAAIALALGGVLWFFHWTVSTSGGFNPPGEEDYYNFLVRGWREGHLYMSKAPRPEMLALSDPYDPAQNAAVRLGDASYFKGHYYLYFGAGPAAVLLAPYYIVTGRELGTTTAVFIFCSVGYLAMSGVWLAVRRRYFPKSAVWLGAAGVLALGIGTHLLALQRRPLVWELPIATAFAFSMLALAAVFWALHGRRPIFALTLAGLSIGLAVTARPTYLLGTGLLLPPLWVLAHRAGRDWRWARGVLAAGGGLVLCVGLVLTHNYARFGQALEFGQNYQLTGVYESKVRHFHWTYVPHNLRIYAFQPPAVTKQFPFIRATAVRGGPKGYLGEWNEAVCGLLVTLPFFWLLGALPLTWRIREAGGDPGLRAMMVSTGLLGFALAAVILAYFLATPRYASDFAPTLGLLAMMGALGLERWAQERNSGLTRKMTLGGMGFVFAITVIIGALVSLDYHDQLLRRINPPVWDRLENILSTAK